MNPRTPESTAPCVTDNPASALDSFIRKADPSGIFLLCDSNTRRLALPLIAGSDAADAAIIITITPGDDNKTLEAAASVWQTLSDAGATRNSILINLGGGLVTDLGGFAASTFKRGIRYLNIPTTLLGAVDAATGGKTAVNFNGLKNEIGTFALPETTIVSTIFFNTLPDTEFMSGYAEMIKTAMLFDKKLYYRLLDIATMRADSGRLAAALEACIAHKAMVTAIDPTERGLRKTLNLGHTAGHAFESIALAERRPVAHGVAVAHGLLAEMVLANIILGFPSTEIHRYAAMMREYYPKPIHACRDTDRIIDIMGHDKKNRDAGQPEFTLLKDIADPKTGCVATRREIAESLEIARDFLF